ncbi:MAG: septal ring lytic transglycosylase RlpA family protein [Ignavibacteriaceae bacterium]|jgi:rare lipoprotein A (peptidoglycan hydrolase)
MFKIKLLLPLLMILSIIGLTLSPTKSQITNKNLAAFENPLEATSISQNVNVKYYNLGMMKASWYGPRFHGRLTANGEIYDQMGYTAAHKSLPFGTLLKITNPKINKSVVVRINDRGPYIPGRKIDLSKKVAMELDTYNKGVVKLKVEKIKIIGINSPILN